MNLEQLARHRPILALLLAPCMGALFVIFLPLVGWILLIHAGWKKITGHTSCFHRKGVPLISEKNRWQ